MLLKSLYARPFVVLRDGDETPPADTPPPAPPKDEVTFDEKQQAKINSLVAAEKRKYETELKTLKTQHETLLSTHNLTAETRASLESQVESLNKQLAAVSTDTRTKEQQLRSQFEGEIKTLKEGEAKWRDLYMTSRIDTDLFTAAERGEAFSTTQIVELLRPRTKMVEVKDEKSGESRGLQPMIDFNDIDPDTKQPVITRRSPADAVNRMKELPEIYGNLFKSGVVSGLGEHYATGGAQPGNGGRINVKKITSQEDYARIRKENPALLGVKPKRRW